MPRDDRRVVSVLVAVVLLAAAVTVLAAADLVVLVRVRHRAASLPNAFRCKVAVTTAGEHSYRWPRRVSYAVWEHDVLIQFDGFTRTRVRPHAVHFAEGPVATMVRPVRGLDARPVVLAVETDDGGHTLVAAPRSSGDLVAGPFLAALLSA